MSTPERRPLWRVMHEAYVDTLLRGDAGATYAAEIRALRDHLIQCSRLQGLDQEARNAVYRHLTGEAERAELGQ